MDIDYIKNALTDIKNAVDDDETQHILEDELLWDFVKHINDDSDKYPSELRLMATEILKSKEIDFWRFHS